MGCGVWGLGLGAWGLGFGIWGVELVVWSIEFEVWGLGSGVWDLGFGVWGLAFTSATVGRCLKARRKPHFARCLRTADTGIKKINKGYFKGLNRSSRGLNISYLDFIIIPCNTFLSARQRNEHTAEGSTSFWVCTVLALVVGQSNTDLSGGRRHLCSRTFSKESCIRANLPSQLSEP